VSKAGFEDQNGDMTMTATLHDPLLGAWATLGEPRLANELAQSGLGWVGLDAQHGHFDDRSVRETLGYQPVSAAPRLVRVASNSAMLIGRALDAGADGVIVPLVSTVADAAAAVAASHYPPHGSRSWGPLHGSRPVHGPGSDGGRHPVPLCSVMIETAEALEAVGEIAAVPGVDMIFVGPFDLSLALGLDIDEMLGSQDVDAPLARIVRACSAAGIEAGAYAGTPERAVVLAGAGFRWIASTTDVGLLALGVESLGQRLSVAAGRDQSVQDALRAGKASS
jgi:4-hydroxy-2-oxoheptanedioate aldolase